MIYRNHVLRRWLWLTALLACGCGAPKPAADAPAPTPSKAAEPLRVAAASDLQAGPPGAGQAVHRGDQGRGQPDLRGVGPARRADQGRAPRSTSFLAANQSFVKDLADGGFVRPESVRPYAQGTLVAGGPSRLGRGDPGPGRPGQARGETDRAGQPRLRAVRGRRQAGAGTFGRVAGRLVEDRPVRDGPPGVAVRPVGQRRGRAGRALDRRGPRGPSPSRSTRSSTTRSSRPWGSWPRSPRREIAEAFARFVLGDEGQALLLQSGFRKPAAVP